MKKLAFLLALLLLMACAAQPEPVVTTEAPVTEATVSQTEVPTEAETTEAAIEPSEFEYAKTFIDKDLEELTAAIGEPLETYYEESCIGDGWDGILTYADFTVFTFRDADGSAETVIDAELND